MHLVFKLLNHKGVWWPDALGSVPGINSGRPRHTRDVGAGLGGNSRGRMSAGQTGLVTGQMGHVYGRNAHQGVSRQNSLSLLVFFVPIDACFTGRSFEVILNDLKIQ